MATLDEARATVTGKYATARGDIETNFGEALSTLTDAYATLNAQIEEMAASPGASVNAWLQSMGGSIKQGIDDLALYLVDVQQRGGRMGTTGVGEVVNRSLNALMPLTSEAVKNAFGYQERVGLRKLGATEAAGIGKAGLMKEKGTTLAGLSTGEAGELTKISSQQSAQEAALAQQVQELANALKLKEMEYANQLAIAGKLTAESTTSTLGKLGVTPNLKAILKPGESSDGMGGIGGSGSSGYTLANALADLEKSYQVRNLAVNQESIYPLTRTGGASENLANTIAGLSKNIASMPGGGNALNKYSSWY